MRSRILTSLLLALVIAPPGLARAQEAEAEDPEGGETEGADVADEPRSTRVPNVAGARETAPGEVHTVVGGDTLWDLSQQYLGSPWYWPKVWSYNPEIANPHWIYPGNRVRFFPAGEEVPSRVETGIGPDDTTDDIQAATELSGEDLVSVSGKISYQPQGTTLVTTQAFVTQKEVDEAGRIDNSFSDAEMLSFPDKVYVRFKRKTDAKVGDRYLIFRTVQEVQHPVNKKRKVGYLTELNGTLKVLTVGDKFVTAQIQDTWNPIERTNLVGPYGEKLTDRIAVKPNSKPLKGYIVTALVPYLTLTGEHSLMVVDKGSADGVETGNVFTIVRQEDTVGGTLLNPTQKDKALPVEAIGLCLVTEVKERASNCLLTSSLREIVPGDQAELRVGKAPTASR
ncbi:LysM peptidoglycan-binding domain-containing protein [Stigmatella aurantiaca]|uniref:LysM domain protein n=1 Tax=Stigmatella aurantiaca (strain DW4/3-1) TaxID=378806 RepID=E3FI92_STIAD|nr:LysM peptidoglycan-binding domain-containing protein [Stigmatella aurantiaca]ADO72882.1 LysM domain protein [Stigmatella aurantiaca DW4/3-1]